MSRSSPLGAMDYQITIEHNDILRKVTKERNISFYDYSGDIWATLGGYDPNKSAVAGAKMLSKRYSQQLVQHDSSYKLKTMKGVEIKFMVAHDAQHGNMQYYFTDYVNGTRHKWHVFAHSAAESRKNKRQLVEVLSAGEATKHGFNGLAAFIRKGFDFDQVIVITTFWWMEVLPTGSVVE
eukprot:gene30323-37516_t